MKTKTATGIVVAHDHAVVVLDNCEVDAAGTAVNGLQAVAVLLIGRPDTDAVSGASTRDSMEVKTSIIE